MQTTQFVYDGKESSNALLLAKARAFLRQSEKYVWRELEEGDDEESDEEGWVKIPSDTFFDGMWSEKPSNLTDKQYKKLSTWAYDAIVQFMQNSSSAETLRGIASGDGAELLKRLHTTKGDKRSQINRWNGVLRNPTVSTIREWPKYRATMKEAVAERNNIPGLAANEEMDDGTLFSHFYCGL